MVEPLRLQLPRSYEAFAWLNAALDPWLEKTSVNERPALLAKLVVEEIIRNLIEHGREPQSDQIDVEVRTEDGGLQLLIEDDSEPFDPHDAPQLEVDDPAGRTTGGMGLHLVRSMATAVEYRRERGRNRLHVVLADDPPGEEPS